MTSGDIRTKALDGRDIVGSSTNEVNASWKKANEEFDTIITGCQYGEEETRDARTWFLSGWLAAKKDEQ